MKAYSNGNLIDRISAAGNPAYPGYVVKGDEKNIMIDAGINLLGPAYLKSLDEILGSKEQLDYLFVTHSHYDHLGALPYIKRKIPELKIGGFGTIEDLLRKESVIKRMNELSDLQRVIFKDVVGDEDVYLESVNFDFKLKDGDKFDLGGLTCEVYETPGHTRDGLSFFIPEIKALFPGEVIGVPDWKTGENVEVVFLTSYQDYLDGIKKLAKLEPEFIGMAHGWYFTGDDAKEYMKKTYTETVKHKELIKEYLDSVSGNIEDAIEKIARIEYDEKGTIFQERNAYLANLTAQVKHVASLK